MGRAKEIRVKVIPSKIANTFVRKNHYSGRVVNTSNLHFGCFLDGKLHGAMSYGSPMIKKNILPMVQNTGWNEMLELNRMAFDEYLPKNAESRCIAISIRLIKKNAPHIKWILSFSDGTQCGDGTIYRASGFHLTSIKNNNSLYRLPDGRVINNLNMTGKYMLSDLAKRQDISSAWSYNKNAKILGAKKVQGFQLRYIYLIDKACKITVPILPFSKIDEMNAGMYKGKKRLQADAHKRGSKNHLEKGGANPTRPLHLKVTYG
jgi:hypothetical protein